MSFENLLHTVNNMHPNFYQQSALRSPKDGDRLGMPGVSSNADWRIKSVSEAQLVGLGLGAGMSVVIGLGLKQILKAPCAVQKVALAAFGTSFAYQTNEYRKNKSAGL